MFYTDKGAFAGHKARAVKMVKKNGTVFLS